VELAFIVLSADLLINGSRIVTLWSNDLACVKMLRVLQSVFYKSTVGVGGCRFGHLDASLHSQEDSIS